LARTASLVQIRCETCGDFHAWQRAAKAIHAFMAMPFGDDRLGTCAAVALLAMREEGRGSRNDATLPYPLARAPAWVRAITCGNCVGARR